MRIGGVFELRNEYLFGRPVADVIWVAFATSNPMRDKSVQMSLRYGRNVPSNSHQNISIGPYLRLVTALRATWRRRGRFSGRCIGQTFSWDTALAII